MYIERLKGTIGIIDQFKSIKRRTFFSLAKTILDCLFAFSQQDERITLIFRLIRTFYFIPSNETTTIDRTIEAILIGNCSVSGRNIDHFEVIVN